MKLKSLLFLTMLLAVVFPLLAVASPISFAQELATDAFWQLPDLRVFLVYAVAGSIGVIAHYIHEWYRGRITGNLFTYLFVDYPKSTLSVGVGFYSTALGLFLSGQLNGSTLGSLCLTGFLAGYAIDSVLNKSAVPNSGPDKSLASVDFDNGGDHAP